MKLTKLVFGGLLIIVFSSFSPFIKSKDKGQIAYNKGNYSEALKIWSKSIAKYERRHKAAKCKYFTKAGEAALKLGNIDLARKYLEDARYTVSENENTFEYLAQIYRKINNLSLEIDALENYVKKYPNGKYIAANRNRLFMTYVESENWKEALHLWPQITSTVQGKLDYQTGLLKVYEGLKNNKAADKLAAKIMKLEPKNTTALEWMAKKYFWLAENSYRAENKAYKMNQTSQQYIHLLKAYKVITINFKRSLRYFRTLYALAPSAKSATFLEDIYARLSDSKKASYYHSMAKKLK